MNSNRNARVGEIVLLDFPYTNQAGSKVRPAVIISQSSDRLSDITVAYMTSEVDNYCFNPSAVIVDPTDLETGAIRQQSGVIPAHPGTSARQVFIPPTTSPWVRAAPSIPMIQS